MLMRNMTLQGQEAQQQKRLVSLAIFFFFLEQAYIPLIGQPWKKDLKI